MNKRQKHALLARRLRNKADQFLNWWERDLPRTQTCKLIAVPKEEHNDVN